MSLTNGHQEFGELYEVYQTKNPIFLHGDYDHFDLDHLDKGEVYAKFRVQKKDIERLASALGHSSATSRLKLTG